MHNKNTTKTLIGILPKYTLSKYIEAELKEKKSRFIAQLTPVKTEKSALEFISDMKKKHSTAKHNVYAYILRDGTARYSDDGEPHHTAGLPILELLKHENMQNIACVVTRYFGGILLGTGGLVRAYTGSVKSALDKAIEQELIIPDIELEQHVVMCSYSELDSVKNKLIGEGALNLEFDFGGQVKITFDMPKSM